MLTGVSLAAWQSTLAHKKLLRHVAVRVQHRWRLVALAAWFAKWSVESGEIDACLQFHLAREREQEEERAGQTDKERCARALGHLMLAEELKKAVDKERAAREERDKGLGEKEDLLRKREDERDLHRVQLESLATQVYTL